MGDPVEAQLAPGAMVGGYRVEHRLGAGGVGTVYAAEDPAINKRVAIKVLKRAFADDEASAARFEREARAANAIRHPGIVDVFGIGKLDDGRPYLVMSLLDGRSLRDEIAARGRIPLAEAWSLAREIAETLEAAHEGGVIHRDLKPDNVFLERFGARAARPRLLDFGIAKVQSTDDGEALMKLTQTGVPIGTPTYMAPEQWWCHEVTHATDQYCFGVMFFEMLAGRPPFASQQFVELLQQHLHAPAPTLASVGVDVPPEVEALVAKTLAKDGASRFASMDAVVRAGDAAIDPARARDSIRGVVDDAQAGGDRGGDVSAPGGSPELAVAETLAAPSTPALKAVPGAASGPLRRFFAIHVLTLAATAAAVIAMGYAGRDEAHDPIAWLHIGGFAQFGNLGAGVIGFGLMAMFALRRAATGRPNRGAFLAALFVGVTGTLGTYTGWRKVLEVVPTGAVHSFAIFNEGMFEANATRFLGFSISVALCVSLAALPGVSGLGSATRTLTAAVGIGRREGLIAAAGLAGLAALAIALGAPAAAFVAGVACAVSLVGVALPTLHADTAARDEIERALAGLLAVGIATAVAFTRVEAREAVLWAEQPTRAARIDEILAAAKERDATLGLAIASLAIVAFLEGLRLSRLWRRKGALRPSVGTALLACGLALAVAGDVIVHAGFIGSRDALRAATAGEFALFARLDPPRADDLDRERFPTHRATALQVTRDAVAVNAKGIAKLAALETAEGAARLAQDLSRTLAQAAVDRPAADPSAPSPGPKGDVDLSLCVDSNVPASTVARLMKIAAGSVRRVDVLLTRGPPPRIPINAPPETQIVVPNDFVAVPVELSDEGGLALDAAPRAKFGDAVRSIVAEARAHVGPVRVALPKDSTLPERKDAR